MEHQRCYIYEPSATEERAPKRQRTSEYDPHAQLPERLQTYRDVWSQQEERIKVRRSLQEKNLSARTDLDRTPLKVQTALSSRRL
jgi:hypothetical protein